MMTRQTGQAGRQATGESRKIRSSGCRLVRGRAFLLVSLLQAVLALGALRAETRMAVAPDPHPAGDDHAPASHASMGSRPGPDEALERLLAGNFRFAGGRSRGIHESPGWRSTLVRGQHPFATVLACSDSRVPVELIFDQGFGDVFVIRVAGNVFAPETDASVLYAVHHLNTPLLVVMGHESCGAVTAAMENPRALAGEPAPILSLLDRIRPALARIAPGVPAEHRLSEGIKENVRHTMEQLGREPVIAGRIGTGQLKVVGCVYEISTGHVLRITP